jgi:hypothetical protein
MFERLLKTTEDTEAHERGGAVPRAVCRAFDAVRGPPLQKPRVVTASGHAGAADIRAAVRAGPASSFKRLRELSERHKREDADIRAAVRRARAGRCNVARRGGRVRAARAWWQQVAAMAAASAMMEVATAIPTATAVGVANHQGHERTLRFRGACDEQPLHLRRACRARRSPSPA